MNRTAIARDHSARHRSHEKKAVKLINLVFRKQANIISIFVRKHGTALALSSLHKLIQPHSMSLALRNVWITVGSDYNKVNILHKSLEPSKHTRFMIAYADSPAAAAKVAKITEETRTRVSVALRQAAESKLNKQDTAKLIQGSTGFSEKRSLLIARTETTMAANMGAWEAAKDIPFPLEKVWIAANDNRTRDSHAAMNGQPAIPFDEQFEVGGEKMMYPGDPKGSAENICNCRCVVAFQVVKEVDVPNPGRSVPETVSTPTAQSEGDMSSAVSSLLDLIDRINAGEVAAGAVYEGKNSI